jgi:DNA-binding IclR family transcriptional regulator
LVDSVSGVGVVDKVAIVLRALFEAPRSLAELQIAADLPRATAHRLAVALETHGLVRRDPDGRFALGLGLVALGHAAAAGFPLAELARPIILRLRDETGESVQLFVREIDGRRAVVSFPSPHALRWIVAEGALLPLDRGSAGRVLADQSESLPGVVESVEEREPGVASASVAVRDQLGRVVAALCVSGPIERLSREPARRFGPALQSASNEIALLLGA